MFPDLISRTPDFEHQLGACVNAMGQDLSLIHISEPTRPRFGSRMPSSA